MERARRKGLHLNTGYQGQGWQVRPLKADGEKAALIKVRVGSAGFHAAEGAFNESAEQIALAIQERNQRAAK